MTRNDVSKQRDLSLLVYFYDSLYILIVIFLRYRTQRCVIEAP